MKKNIKKYLILTLVAAIVTVIAEISCFNYRVLTSGDNYGIRDLHYDIMEEEDKKSLVINLDGSYINKLAIHYSLETEKVPITVKYSYINFFNGTEKNTVEDTLYREMDKDTLYMDKDLYSVEISFEKDIKLDIISISSNNTFNFNPLRAFFVFSILLICVLLYIFWENGFKSENLHIYFALIGFILGLLIIVLQPSMTYYSWDDQIHFENTINFYGRDVHYSVGETSAVDTNNINVGRGGISSINDREDQESYFDKNVGEQAVGLRRRPTSANIAYLPMTIGYFAAKTVGLPFSVAFRVGKIFNLLLYILLVAYAIKLLKIGKRVLMVIALFPVMIFLASEYSYDAAVFGGITVSLAIIINLLVDKKEKVTFKKLLVMLVAMMFACSAKAIYSPLLLLFVLIPNDRFDTKKKAKILKIGIILISVFLLAAGVLGTTGGMVSGDARGGNTSVSGQLASIFRSPVDFLVLLKRQAVDQFYRYMVGPSIISFSYASEGDFSNLYFLLFTVFVFVGITDTNEKNLQKNKKICSAVLISAVAVLIWVALYLTFTPVGEQHVNGVQPRYFIPLLLPLVLCLQPKRIKTSISPRLYNLIVLSLLVIIALIRIGETFLIQYCL